MGVEIEFQFRVTFNHYLAEFQCFIGAQYAQGIWEHEVCDRLVAKSIDQLEYIIGRMEHTVGPVFEVEVDGKIAFFSQCYITFDIIDMLLWGFMELTLHMFKGALREEVDDFAACGSDPVDRYSVVDKAESFDSIDISVSGSPVANIFQCFQFSGRDASRSHFNAVDADIVEEKLSDSKFLISIERDAGGLFAIA